jgi:hypothetical protein
MPAALAEVMRNEMVESVHYGHLVLLNAKGEIQLQLGDINLPIFPRSCVKPLQARERSEAERQVVGGGKEMEPSGGGRSDSTAVIARKACGEQEIHDGVW